MLRRHQAQDAARPWRRIERRAVAGHVRDDGAACRVAIAVATALRVRGHGATRTRPFAVGSSTIGWPAIHCADDVGELVRVREVDGVRRAVDDDRGHVGERRRPSRRSHDSLMSGSREPITASIGIRIPASRWAVG